MALTPREYNALRKAVHMNAAALVTRVEYGFYTVPSATEPGRVYAVQGTAADGSDHLCNCPAGQNGHPCWHSAAVRLRRTQEEAKRQARKLAARVS